MAKRANRTTKQQFEIMLDFFEKNKVMVYQDRSHPLKENVYNEKWQFLTNSLNSSGVGPSKTIDQWKRVFTELKTNTKRHYRQWREEIVGTGGGEKKVKPLLDYEERLLNLLSKVALNGASLPEAGVVQENQMEIDNTENIVENISVTVVDPATETLSFAVTEEEWSAIDATVHSSTNEVQPVEPINLETLPPSSTSTRVVAHTPSKKKPMKRLVKRTARLDNAVNKYDILFHKQIEMQKYVVESQRNLTEAIANLTAAVKQSNVDISSALNNICVAINNHNVNS